MTLQLLLRLDYGWEFFLTTVGGIGTTLAFDRLAGE